MKTKIYLLPVISMIIFGFAFTSKFNSPVKIPKQISKEFSLIPSGTAVVNNTTVNVNYFYMSKTEVSNRQYIAFLNDLKTNNEIEKLKIATIDTSNWVKEFGNDGVNYATYYHSHVSYANFPVVNISKAGAELYCAWLTQKLNKENQGLEFFVRLPVEAEWLRACNPYNNEFPYSWQGHYLRGENGNLLCNFRNIGTENIYYDSLTKSFQLIDFHPSKKKESAYSDITAPVNSYYPTALGLYNLNGNVAEFIAEGFAMGGSWKSAGYDVRNESKLNITSPSVQVGFRPVFSVRAKS